VTTPNPPTADSLFQRGLDLLAVGSPAGAAQAFRAAIAADPAHIEAHHGLIRALRDAGQLNQSVTAAMVVANARQGLGEHRPGHAAVRRSI